MMEPSIKNKIETEITKLNRLQVLEFAWICAVRALPFLCCNGNFNFWNKKDTQKHIYAILNALDISYASILAAANYTPIDSVSIKRAIKDTEDAGYTAISAGENAIKAASDKFILPNTYVNVAFGAFSFAAYAAGFAAYAASKAVAAATYISISEAADKAFYASINLVNAAQKNNIKIESIILQDLSTIRNNAIGGHQNPIYLYGRGIWENFQNALLNVECGYWARLYKSIIENGFVLDQLSFERRMKVPIEVQMQGAAAVVIYLEELEKGAEWFNEARIIILGDKGTGKTCLARRLIDPKAPMTTDKDSTAGVDASPWRLESEDINISIWDFAGHTVTHAVHQFFLSERCVYIIVYDGRTEERNRLDYWLNHMKNFGGESKAIILVNKRDSHTVHIPINSLKEQYSIEGLYTFSIQDDKSDLETFRSDVVGLIKNNLSWNKMEIPSNYYSVKKELENIFDKGNKKKCTEYITKEIFEKIAKKNGVDNVDGLLLNLHALGVSLWYKGMQEFDTLVLNPEWISHGVYKIINWVSEEKKYSLTLNDFGTVFKKDLIRFPEEKHIYIYKLMIHYELAYESKNEKGLIIPHLLKEDRPVKLPDFQLGESLMLRYKSEQPLPPNTISRFIVRHNQEIKRTDKNDLVWRYGVVLEDGYGDTAMVREEDRTISVCVKGQGKSSYISTLRETLNEIFNTYKSKKPELQYRIERFGQIFNELEIKNPLWLTDSKILNHSKAKIPYYEDMTGQLIDLHYTINNYNINTQNLIEGQGNQFLDYTIHNTFNFHSCNIGLQSDLNILAQSLKKDGNEEEAKELEIAAEALKHAETCKNEDEVKKTGIANRLKRIAEDLGDEDSKLHKTVEGIKHGIGIAQDIASGYNDIAQWLGMPQVPKPFLKKPDTG